MSLSLVPALSSDAAFMPGFDLIESLSNAQLLGVLVGPQQAHGLLQDHCGSLMRLLHEPAAPAYGAANHAVNGAGDAGAIGAMSKLRAATELVRRSLAETLQRTDVLDSPAQVRTYLRMRLAGLGHEVFLVLFLDAHLRVIAVEEMFRGSLTQTSVYPREVVKRVLAHNAAAVILAHNHPSGVAEPSRADELLTQTLRAALTLVDARVVDHVIVGGNCVVSFAERGLL
jgi:DNA repair protein RadC